jgi:hypothetical protein
MKWTPNEQAEISKSHPADNPFYESTSARFEEDDEQAEERHSPNLSMDEYRTLLDEFEEILYAK